MMWANAYAEPPPIAEDDAEMADAKSGRVANPKAKGKAKAKSVPKASASPPESLTNYEWEPDLRKQIKECLAECRSCGEYGTTQKHTHRPVDAYDDFAQFSVYWSRSAVGVKVRNNLSDKWIQVAYFARDTPCVLTNVILAKCWVACLFTRDTSGDGCYMVVSSALTPLKHFLI